MVQGSAHWCYSTQAIVPNLSGRVLPVFLIGSKGFTIVTDPRALSHKKALYLLVETLSMLCMLQGWYCGHSELRCCWKHTWRRSSNGASRSAAVSYSTNKPATMVSSQLWLHRECSFFWWDVLAVRVHRFHNWSVRYHPTHYMQQNIT
jgi:hypothetical protein